MTPSEYEAYRDNLMKGVAHWLAKKIGDELPDELFSVSNATDPDDKSVSFSVLVKGQVLLVRVKFEERQNESIDVVFGATDDWSPVASVASTIKNTVFLELAGDINTDFDVITSALMPTIRALSKWRA
jgi:hypothetical protein